MAPDKRVLLFGRTGDGKSTIANVLVTGGIDNVVFKSSDGVRGCTSTIQTESGRGWKVTDTVGLGEAESGNTSTTVAKDLLKDFLNSVKDSYSHLIYVQKASRITTIDELIWSIFASIFEGVDDAFIVLFTGADEKWLGENRDKLPAYLRNQTILVTDIPPIKNRPLIEKRHKEIRKKSIEKLQSDLESHFINRGSKFYTPHFTTQTDKQLEETSWNLLKHFMQLMERLFKKPGEWVRGAKTIANFTNFSSFTSYEAVTLASVNGL